MFFVKRMLPMLLLMSCLMLGACASEVQAEGRDVSIGLAADNGAVQFVVDSNILGGFNHATVYGKLGEPLAYRKFHPSFNIIYVVKIPHTGKEGNLSLVSAGTYDVQLRKLAQDINKDGRAITLRILPEFNGHWYPWGVYRKGNTPEDFVIAWRHIVKLIRSETKLVHFDLNYNRKSSEVWNTSDFEMLYPGDEWVDSVSISSYNRCGTSKAFKTAYSFAQEFRPAYDTIVEMVGPTMPIMVAETATTSMCGVKRKEWYRDLFLSVRNSFSRVTNITFFFVTKDVGTASNDVVIHWELETEDEVKAFRALLLEFRKSLSITPPERIRGKRFVIPGTKKSKVIEKPEDKEESVVRYPWSLYGKLETVFDDRDIDALNPLTGEPFGTIGTRLRFKATQAIEWDVPGVSGWVFGPKVSIDGVISDNPNQWWNNAIGGTLGLQVCDKNRPASVHWGGVCAYGQVHHKEYVVPAPKDSSTTFSIGVQLNIGGDWSKSK